MEKFNLEKQSDERIRQFKDEINKCTNSLTQQMNSILERLKSLQELVSLYDQASSDFYKIMSTYSYEYEYMGSLSSNVEPRENIETMKQDTKIAQELQNQIQSLEREINYEIEKIDSIQRLNFQTLEIQKENILSLQYYWRERINQKIVF